MISSGQHPANNYYPTVAWDVGEVVADYHELERPFSSQSTHSLLEVALAPPFADLANLEWQSVGEVEIAGENSSNSLVSQRATLGKTHLTGIQFPKTARNGEPIVVQASGFGRPSLNFRLGDRVSADSQFDEIPASETEFLTEILIANVPEENGTYTLYATDLAGTHCGWLRTATACPLGQIEISGVPLPDGAHNFDDQIALLDWEIDQSTLVSGSRLNVTATWQSLQAIDNNYTLFIQVLDENDQIVGQLDTWPLQGTLPTSSWEVGETLNDSYKIQLDSGLSAGNYRVIMGWYLLADLRRLPVLNAEGEPIRDYVASPTLKN